MTKTLLLMRHAHSNERLPEQLDKQRELSLKGKRECLQIAHLISISNYSIDFVLTSSATRCLTTASIVADVIKYDPSSISQHDDLYESSMKNLLTHLHSLSDEYSNVLLVNHNPALSYLAEFLCNSEINPLPPAGLVVLEFNLQRWQQIDKSLGELLIFTHPDLLA